MRLYLCPGLPKVMQRLCSVQVISASVGNTHFKVNKNWFLPSQRQKFPLREGKAEDLCCWSWCTLEGEELGRGLSPLPRAARKKEVHSEQFCLPKSTSNRDALGKAAWIFKDQPILLTLSSKQQRCVSKTPTIAENQWKRVHQCAAVLTPQYRTDHRLPQERASSVLAAAGERFAADGAEFWLKWWGIWTRVVAVCPQSTNPTISKQTRTAAPCSRLFPQQQSCTALVLCTLLHQHSEHGDSRVRLYIFSNVPDLLWKLL